jgi:hypothetical protein
MQRAHAARLEGAEDGTIASADGRDPLPELVMACGNQRSGHNVAVAVQIFPTTNHPQHLEDLNNDTSSLQYRPVPPLRSPDTIAMVGNRVGLLEFKTSSKPYPDHLIAMAAHGRLWEETHPHTNCQNSWRELAGWLHSSRRPGDRTLPIRFLPTPPTCRVLPGS